MSGFLRAGVHFPSGTPVQQQEEQMDCGAANLDPSDDATSQVNKSSPIDVAVVRAARPKVQRSITPVLFRMR